MTDRITMRRIPDGSGFVLDHPTVSKWEAVVFVSEGEVPADVAELVAELRRSGKDCCPTHQRDLRAADMLEAQTRRRDEWKRLAEVAQDKIESQALRIAELEAWDDVDDEWSPAIHEAHPTRSGFHELYGIAMQMVGHRHSKGALVSLVTWLLAGGWPEYRKARAERAARESKGGTK